MRSSPRQRYSMRKDDLARVSHALDAAREAAALFKHDLVTISKQIECSIYPSFISLRL
jgi:hypothetical protein